MPIFSDIFIAKEPADAILYDISSPNHPHVILQMLTDHEISALWASLNNAKLSAKYDLEFIDIDSEAILYQFPNDFTEALAQLDDKRVLTAASIWSEYEDIPWRRDEAQQKIKDICQLAHQAIAEKKALFLMFI